MRKPDTPVLAHAVTWVPMRDLPASTKSGAYVDQLAEAYRRAARGESEWPPPIPCFMRDGRLALANGNNRTAAAKQARVSQVPIQLFASMAHYHRACDQ